MPDPNNILNPTMAPGTQVTEEEDPPAGNSPIPTATYTLYALVWAFAYQVPQGSNIPMGFTFSRPDGQQVSLVTGDEVSITLTDPSGATSPVTNVTATSLGPAATIVFWTLFSYAQTGTYTFEVALQHDGQTIEAVASITVL